VPLADHSGFVTSILEQLWEGLLAAIKLFSIVDDAVDVTVFSGQYYGPAGGTD
jgi:hypothetical protein